MQFFLSSCTFHAYVNNFIFHTRHLRIVHKLNKSENMLSTIRVLERTYTQGRRLVLNIGCTWPICPPGSPPMFILFPVFRDYAFSRWQQTVLLIYCYFISTVTCHPKSAWGARSSLGNLNDSKILCLNICKKGILSEKKTPNHTIEGDASFGRRRHRTSPQWYMRVAGVGNMCIPPHTQHTSPHFRICISYKFATSNQLMYRP